MDNAQLITLSRQIALQRQMDVVANNMANINTNGFKSSEMLFSDYLMPVAAENEYDGTDSILHFTDDWSTRHDMTTGPIEQTGNPLDVALEGEGFLTVQTPAGVRYTRNGALQIDASGTLVDLNGNPVLTDAGPIKFSDTDTNISIAQNGAISTANGSKGTLQISEFTDPQVLAHEGDNYFSGPAGNANANTRVVQGSIERSNVSGVTEMASMIRVTRAYETLAGILQRQDELQTSAIQQLGDVTA